MYTVKQKTVCDAIATSEKIVEKHYMEKVSATLVHKVGAISSAVIQAAAEIEMTCFVKRGDGRNLNLNVFVRIVTIYGKKSC